MSSDIRIEEWLIFGVATGESFQSSTAKIKPLLSKILFVQDVPAELIEEIPVIIISFKEECFYGSRWVYLFSFIC